MATNTAARDDRIELRATEEEKRLLASAAAYERLDLTSFIMRKALARCSRGRGPGRAYRSHGAGLRAGAEAARESAQTDKSALRRGPSTDRKVTSPVEWEDQPIGRQHGLSLLRRPSSVNL
jgi:hypothetical protein